MTNMSGELNIFDNLQNTDYYDLAGETDNYFLDNFDLGQADWNDFAFTGIVPPSPQVPSKSPRRVSNGASSTTVDMLTTLSPDARTMPWKVPPMPAGSTQLSQQQVARRSSLDDTFNDLPSAHDDSSWQDDDAVDQFQPPRERRISLTPGLTATPSPRMRTVEPARLAFYQGNPVQAHEEMTDMPQLVTSNTLFAVPSPVQLASGAVLGEPDFTFDYNDPEVQRILNDPNYMPDFSGVDTEVAWDLVPQPPTVQPPVPDAMMQGFVAPTAVMVPSKNLVLDAIMADPIIPTSLPEAPPKQLQPLNQYTFNFPDATTHTTAPHQPVAAAPAALPRPTTRTHRNPPQKVAKPAPVPPPRRRRTQPIPGHFEREAAKLSREKHWVRVNERAGANNRGGKLNQYDPADHYTPAPSAPTWTAGGHTFEYDDNGELAELTYSAKQIDAYLRHHNRQTGRKLRVWIQKAPADSGRRSAQKESAECRFAECPLRRLGKHGTIWQGHLRVAFDENYDAYARKRAIRPVDPFQLAACAHLYCFERFLDVPDLLQYVTVKLDSRVIDTEPNGQFPCRLDPDDREDRRHFAAIDYMAATKRGALVEFPHKYPKHASYPNGKAKPHELTLNGVMNKLYIDDLPPPKRRMWIKRDSQSSMFYTLGDLDKYCAAKWPELWAAHKQGRSLKGVKEPPKYERGTRGYAVSSGERKRQERKIKKMEAEKMKKRKRYESESEEDDEDDTDTSDSESELDLHDYSSSEDERREKKRSAKRQKRTLRDESDEDESDEDEGTSKTSKKVKSGRSKQPSNPASDEDEAEERLSVPAKPRRSLRKAGGQKVQYNEQSDMDC